MLTGGVVALLLLVGAVVAGTAVAHGGGTGLSAATASGQATPGTIPPAAVGDLHQMAGDICSASQSDMEHWLTVARNAYPDAGRFADFLSSEAAVIDETCPRRRPTFDDATAAATNVRIGANGEAP